MIIESIAIGVSASLTASLMFLWVLYRFKPKIIISPYIADITEGDQHRYAFKIINKTKSTIFDIKVQVLLIEPIRVHGGPVSNVTELNLFKDHFFELGPYNKKDKDAHYALRFGTDTDLKKIWSSNTQFLRVNVVSRHAMSGFSKVESFIINTKGSIKPGKHEFGEGLDVKPT